jgi:hypothetical protein
MKIKIPPEVMKAWHDHCADNLATTYEEAFAAALAAWPGMEVHVLHPQWRGNFINLPLPQETSDA